MKTANRGGRKVVNVTGADAGASKGKPAEAGRSQSHDKLEQRVAELEQQNAELAQANKILTDDRGQLEALLETTPDNIYFKDRESRFVRMSRAKAELTMHAVRNAYRSAHPNDKPDDWPPHLTGVKSFTEWLIGKTDFDTFPNEHARMALAEEQGIIATGQPMIGKLQKVIRHDGTSVWLLTTKLPWRDKDGSIIGTLGVTRNVTELKEAEESLAQERLLPAHTD